MDRIKDAKNRLFESDRNPYPFGKNVQYSLSTNSSHIYRLTGISQIEDIIECGFVRPPEGKNKGGHEGEVFWTRGGDKLFYYDKYPVLETSVEILKQNDQIGALSINELTAIYIFDEQENKYVNKLNEYKIEYLEKQKEKLINENNQSNKM